MTYYEYEKQTFDPEQDVVEIPDDAIGVSLDTMGDFEGGLVATARYLVPTNPNTAETSNLELPDQ